MRHLLIVPFLIAAPAVASLPVVPAGAQQAADVDSNKVVCARKPVTGARAVFKRDCRTAAEWQRLAVTSLDPSAGSWHGQVVAMPVRD
jgi:hypothetical protein